MNPGSGPQRQRPPLLVLSEPIDTWSADGRVLTRPTLECECDSVVADELMRNVRRWNGRYGRPMISYVMSGGPGDVRMVENLDHLPIVRVNTSDKADLPPIEAGQDPFAVRYQMKDGNLRIGMTFCRDGGAFRVTSSIRTSSLRDSTPPKHRDSGVVVVNVYLLATNVSVTFADLVSLVQC